MRSSASSLYHQEEAVYKFLFVYDYQNPPKMIAENQHLIHSIYINFDERKESFLKEVRSERGFVLTLRGFRLPRRASCPEARASLLNKARLMPAFRS